MFALQRRLALFLFSAVAILGMPGETSAQRLSREDREQSVVRISELMEERYIFEEVAAECADLAEDTAVAALNFLPTGRAINPITGTNWEGVGVKPHVEVPAEQALETALARATEASR